MPFPGYHSSMTSDENQFGHWHITDGYQYNQTYWQAKTIFSEFRDYDWQCTLGIA